MSNILGPKLAHLRKAKGLTQDKLADLVEYDRPTYVNIENGKRLCPKKLLKKLATVLEAPYEQLYALREYEDLPPEVRPWLLEVLKELS